MNLYLDDEMTVFNQGTACFNGVESNPVKVSSSSGYYNFIVNSGGTLMARYCEFENMSGAGINIEDGAYVEPDFSFYGCTFKNGESGSAFLTLDNSQDLMIIEPVFDLDVNMRYNNVAKNTDQGTVTLLDATGSFTGDGYTYDPYNRVSWQNRAELYISSVTWSDAAPYGGDVVACTAIIQNSGAGESASCFLDLYLNESVAPEVMQVGDMYLNLGSIEPGDSMICEFSNISYFSPCQWSSWLQIDTDDTVLEINDENNIWGPDGVTWQPLPMVEDLLIDTGNNQNRQVSLSWTYPLSVTRFEVYGSTTPDFIPSINTFVIETISSNCSISDQTSKFFYKVIAVRDSTSRIVPSFYRSGRRISGN